MIQSSSTIMAKAFSRTEPRWAPSSTRTWSRAAILALAIFLPKMVVAKTLIDYFQPTPIVCTPTTNTWGASSSIPRDTCNGIEDTKKPPQYIYWDGKIIRAKDGKYHLFCSRWAGSSGHNGWFGSDAVHAVSDSSPIGPFVDKGFVYSNGPNGTRGHNVSAVELLDGTYAMYVSEIVPFTVFTASSLDGPWTNRGHASIDKSGIGNVPDAGESNVSMVARPDGNFEIVQRHGVIALSTTGITGPYKVQQPTNTYPSAIKPPNNLATVFPYRQKHSTDDPYAPGSVESTGSYAEDPVIWYSGGLYHIVYDYPDDRVGYHLTSKDGIHDWTDQGLAYDPRIVQKLFKNSDGSTVSWYKMERPGIYMENGHPAYFSFAVTDVEKGTITGGSNHGNKVIVVKFDGVSFDHDFGGGGDTQPPSAPTNLASPSKTSTSVSLTWTAATDNVGVNGYQIFNGTTQVATSTTTSATVSGLTPSTAYSFTVKAQDSDGNLSTASNAVSVTTSAAGPIAINVGGDTTGSFVADAYFSGGTTYSNTATVTAPSDVPAAIFNSERYGPFTYTLTGYAPGSAWNVTLYFAETYLTAAGQRAFNVSINGAQVLTAFDIYTAAGGANIGVAKTLAATADGSGQITIGFATGGVENPKVNAISITQGVFIDTQAPSTPGTPTATSVGTTSLTLSWSGSTDNVGVSGYDVYNGTTVAASSTTTSASLSSLQPNTSYTFTVKAKDAAGNVSAASGAVTVRTLTPPDTLPPSAPSGLSAPSVGTTSVALSWNPSTDNVGVTVYDVYLGSSLAVSSASPSASISGLSPGTTYTFAVRARDAAGNVSQASSALSVTTVPTTDITPPSAPANLIWASDGGTVSLTWSPSTDNVGVTAYELYYGSFDLGAFTDTVLTLIGFKSGVPYTFTVKARDLAGNVSVASNQTTVLLAIGQDTTPPTSPTNLTATRVTSSSIGLSWTASTDDVGVVVYQVLVSGSLAATVTSPAATVTGLSPSTSYAVTAIALDAAGNRSPASAPLSVTTSP